MSEQTSNTGWLILSCKGGWESKASSELKKRGYDTWLPMETCERINRGTPTLRDEPFVPGYLFLAKTDTLENMRPGKIRSTIGVLNFVNQACGPNALQPAVISESIKVEIERLIIFRRSALVQRFAAQNAPREFGKGESVRIISGPFTGCTGTVSELFVVSPQERIKLLLDGDQNRVPFSIQAAHVAQTATIMGGGSVSGAPPHHLEDTNVARLPTPRSRVSSTEPARPATKAAGDFYSSPDLRLVRNRHGGCS